MNPRQSLVAPALLLALAVSSCGGNGKAAFLDSQKAAMAMRHFNIELSETTRIGEFKTIQSLDCDAGYFYQKELTDLNPVGIAEGVTLSQGRPRKHKESEMVFVNGKTYGRNTSGWENPSFGTDDAHLEWGPLSISKDPKEECAQSKAGKSFGYVNYEKVLSSAKIEYLGRQNINGHRCREYKTQFPDRTYVDSAVCFGTKDDLPYRVVAERYSATYSYDEVVKVTPENSPPLEP